MENYLALRDNYPLVKVDSQIAVTNRVQKTTNVLNSTGLFVQMQQSSKYTNFKQQLAEIVCGYVEHKQNQKFHESLNIVQKAGFFTDTNRTAFQRELGMKKMVAGIGTQAVCDFAVSSVDWYLKRREINNMLKFYIGGLAFIAGHNSYITRHKSVSFYRRLGKKFNEDEFNSVCYSIAANGLRSIPRLSDTEKTKALYYDMLAAVDSQDDESASKAQQLADFVGIDHYRFDEVLSENRENQKLISDITAYAGACMVNLLSSLADNFEHAKQCAIVCVENDPFENIRAKRHKNISNCAKKGVKLAASGGVAYLTGNPAPFLMTASSMMSDVVNFNMADISKEFKMAELLRNETSAQSSGGLLSKIAKCF